MVYPLVQLAFLKGAVKAAVVATTGGSSPRPCSRRWNVWAASSDQPADIGCLVSTLTHHTLS